MKKNLISILILALLLVNVVLTAIMMFSVTSVTKKTASLVNNIATALNLELESKEEEADTGEVSMVDLVSYDLSDSLTIPLKTGEDGKSHYCLVSVSLLINSTHEDYETLYTTITSNDSFLKSLVIDVIGSHTMDEAQADPEGLREEILEKIQAAYNSTVVYKVTFSSIMYQ